MANLHMLMEIGVDTDEGLACCADDVEFYEEMLKEYVSESKTGLDELNRFYTMQDWEHYGIRAHTTKSTSRMIGAVSFSEIAREMEFAAKEGRAEAIIMNHASFVSGYQQLVDGNQKALI